MTVSAQEHSRSDHRVPVGTFRADIEGLRAVAILLVLAFHSGLSAFSGGFVGVDVFFVISGFLITSQLIGELGRQGRISLPAFYGRRARRILPAAGVVLVAAAAVTAIVAPQVHRKVIGGDIVASALYVVNWRIKNRLASGQLDDPQFTPVSHFWSLAIEEQFYFVWPVILIIAALLARRLHADPKRLAWLAIAAVAVGSFAWSIRDLAASPGTAYYSTITRMWELSVGAGLAFGATGTARLPRPVAFVVGWAGLAAVLASALVFSTQTVWPGYLGAVPTLGTAGIIAAGASTLRGGPAAILSTAPMRWIGRLSYSLYLWHWVVIYLAALSFGGLPPYVSAGAIAVSALLAWLTYTLVENPVRRGTAINASPWSAIGVGLCFTVLGVVAGVLLTVGIR
jgi:peptidoglycan/LPS O-acetylase OafA/YrhL